MDKPRFDHCENYCYGPEGHYCLLWKSNLKECCYSDSICDARNILEVDVELPANAKQFEDKVDVKFDYGDWYIPSEPPL